MRTFRFSQVRFNNQFLPYQANNLRPTEEIRKKWSLVFRQIDTSQQNSDGIRVLSVYAGCARTPRGGIPRRVRIADHFGARPKRTVRGADPTKTSATRYSRR